MVRIGVIGAGNIGTEFARQARNRGYEVGPVVTTSGIYDISKLQSWEGELSAYLHENDRYKIIDPMDYLSPLEEVQFICLAIPTLDNGEAAYKYITELFGKGMHGISTSEKGSLSSHYSDLLETVENGKLGYRATVGGGTSLLPYMKERVRLGFDGKIYVVNNGTLNLCFDGIAKGRSAGEMVYEAKKLGYAEPGAEGTLEVINTEACKDVPRKSTILFNDFMRSIGERKFITGDFVQAATERVTPEMLRELVRQAGNRRYIVSIKRPDGSREDRIGGFRIEYNGWVLEGGFRKISDDPLYQRLLPDGVNNAILIAEGADEIKGVYTLQGPGAGAPPTAKAMLRDLDDMQKAGIVK